MPENNRAGFNRNVLIAVDDSTNAERAVAYVGYLLGGMEGFHVTLLHVIPEPEEDYFPGPVEKERWLQKYLQKIATTLERYRGVLLEAGFRPDSVQIQSKMRYCPSMAECILSERNAGNYGTIVVGRQGLSRKEEFLFGSVSSKIVSHARNCTVWVVE
jgi:nucleotide-binding universal stress UspA family protein